MRQKESHTHTHTQLFQTTRAGAATPSVQGLVTSVHPSVHLCRSSSGVLFLLLLLLLLLALSAPSWLDHMNCICKQRGRGEQVSGFITVGQAVVVVGGRGAATPS